MYQGKTSRSKGENLIWLRCRDLNSGHIGERWVLSPLRHPSIPFLSIYIYKIYIYIYIYIFMYMILLLSFSSSSSSSLHLKIFSNNLFIGEFQSICFLVIHNAAALEQDWSSSVQPRCYIWRNFNRLACFFHPWGIYFCLSFHLQNKCSNE